MHAGKLKINLTIRYGVTLILDVALQVALYIPHPASCFIWSRQHGSHVLDIEIQVPPAQWQL